MKATLMQDRRFWLAGGGVVALLIIGLAWVMFIGPKRSDTDSLRSQTAQVKTQNDALAAKNSALQRDSRKLPDLQARLRRAMVALPPTNALPTFTRDVTAAAADTGVELTNITIGTSSNTGSATAAAPSTAPSSSAPQSGSGASSAAPAEGSSSTSSVTVTVNCIGTAEQDSSFIHELQYGPRSALVTSTQLSASGGGVVMTTQFQIFTAPMTSDAIAQMRRLLAAKI